MRAAVLFAFASSLLAFSGEARADVLAPQLTLTLVPGLAGAPWKLTVQNDGEVPLRVAADARLITLEIVAAKPVVCTLPADARPPSDEGRELVVPGKRAWTVLFDPAFYCFSAKERSALTAGASVKARLGFPTPPAKANANKKKTGTPPAPKPPFVAEPVGAAIGAVLPVKEIESGPVVLTETIDALPPPPPGGDQPVGEVRVSTAPSLDVASDNEISVTTSLTNTSMHPLTVLFRAETIGFTVAGPRGSVACGTPRPVDAPIRELFTTLGVKSRADLTLLLDCLCPDDTFNRPGVYRVTARVDTSGASGRTVGLKTWDGKAESAPPLLLRVRQAHEDRDLPRPHLD